jgi:error-prone DNA polymerase
LVARWGWHDPRDTAQSQFQQAGYDMSDPRIQKFLSLYGATQNLPRHLGQHSGGMVICQGQLDRVVPLEPATMPGRVVIEWDKEDCADLGLIKVDLLGLGMMAVLEDSLELIREHSGEEVDLAHLPQDDPAVYRALQKADTIGMFQVESRAQMSCLPRLKPKKFYDIVVQVAIIRPGPIVGKMLHPYLRRRQGYEEAACLHPSLETVLKRTLGVPLFQEQLLRIAMIAANFTGGEAEELRRAMGFKRSEARMREIETRLRRGMTQNGIVGETQDRIVQSITSFALYGFPESHAASFALIAYASAYLKCHYLAAFTAAMLNNQPMGFYHPATLVKDAQRHGLHFLPVDAERSSWLCSLERSANGDPWSVRLGFNYVRGVRKETAEAIVAARPFASIDDLVRRVPGLRKDELRMLAEIGALNCLAPHRRDALWEAERALRPAGPLFEGLENEERHRAGAALAESEALLMSGRDKLRCAAQISSAISPLAPMTAPERIRADFYGTGLTIGAHPMRLYRESLRSRGVLAAAGLKRVKNGRTVRVAGCVICRQRPGTAHGFLFLSLEVLVTAPYLLIEGVLQNQQGAISVKLRRAEPLLSTISGSPSHDFH